MKDLQAEGNRDKKLPRQKSRLVIAKLFSLQGMTEVYEADCLTLVNQAVPHWLIEDFMSG